MPLNSPTSPRHWSSVILTDVHFWVPLIVLIAGLVLLGNVR